MTGPALAPARRRCGSRGNADTMQMDRQTLPGAPENERASTKTPQREGTNDAICQSRHREHRRIEIHYNDHGQGKPIVLIHGYPLNGNSWERQERVLLEHGYRCISYDRRGFGQSSQPTSGYDYDTFAADLKALLDHLALDQDVVLAGFSMGTGEVTRYLGTYGSAGVSKAALLGVIPPFLLQTDDNPKGVPGEVFEGIKEAIVADRYAYFDDFFANFYNTDVLGAGADRRAQRCGRASTSPPARRPTHLCLRRHLADRLPRRPAQDRRADTGRPRHRGPDPALRGDGGAAPRRELIADLTVVEVENGPHNIGWTHPDETNAAMLAFLSGTPEPTSRPHPRR